MLMCLDYHVNCPQRRLINKHKSNLLNCFQVGLMQFLLAKTVKQAINAKLTKLYFSVIDADW